MTTIKDVARQAGVSTMTVSRVLNNSAPVKAETRERIEAAIKALKYVPNAAARSLTLGQYHAIGLIISPLTHPYWVQVAAAIQRAFSDRGIACILGNSGYSSREERKQLTIALRQGVDGIILLPATTDRTAQDEIKERGLPLVVISGSGNLDVDSVQIDIAGGAHDLTKLLLDLGHRRIGLVNGPRERPMMLARYEGYARALQEAGLSVDPALARFTPSGGKGRNLAARATRELLALPNPPTALFAGAPGFALGAMDVLRERNCRIPEDMPLVVFNEVSGYPSLTVALFPPPSEVGMLAADMLSERMQGDESAPRTRLVPVNVCVRDSTGQSLLVS